MLIWLLLILPVPIIKALVADIEPVTTNEPVIIAEPVNGNGLEAGANEALTAYDADVAILAVDAFCTLLTVRANVLPSPLVYVVVVAIELT